MSTKEFKEIKIERIKKEDILMPSQDGTIRSGLYAIPFILSERPTPDWCDLFIQNWNHPPQYSSMHRPYIVKIYNNELILDGTTIEEVEKYHQETLKLVLKITNEKFSQIIEARKIKEEEEKVRKEKEKKEFDLKNEEAIKRIKFD